MKHLHKTVDFVFLNAYTQYLSDFGMKYQIRTEKKQKKTSNCKKTSFIYQFGYITWSLRTYIESKPNLPIN